MSKEQERLEVRIEITVVQPSQYGGYGQLRISDTFSINARSFLEMCEVLAKFNQLADNVKREQQER